MYLPIQPAQLLTVLTNRLLLLLVLLFSSPTTANRDNEIRTFSVDGNSDLLPTLEAIQQYIANGSEGYFRLSIANGTYHLNATSLATFQNISHVTIVGAGSGSTTIDGGGDGGFVFREVSVLTISNITFLNCSSQQPSTTTTGSSRPGNLTFVNVSAALYLDACSDVRMEDAVARSSPGVGLAMFNTRGTNTFTNSVFCVNLPPDSLGYGGGGVAIEFSFCRPGDRSCTNSDPVEVSHTEFNFTRCHFTENTASSGTLDTDYVYPHGVWHSGFGKGGGLAVYFRGRSSNNSVLLTDCKISYNVAEYGSGLYIEFGDESRGNSFTNEGGLSVIGLNGHTCRTASTNQGQRIYTGGGAMVAFVYYPPDHTLWPGYHADTSDNSVEFRGTKFNTNMACWGGGAAVVSPRSNPSSPQTNSLLFTDCSFQFNTAVSAAALDMSILTPDTSSQGQLLVPNISSCVFRNNTANTRSKVLVPNLAGYQFGSGAVYLNRIPATFAGDNLFYNNQGCGLVVSGSEVFVSEGASIVFDSNTGRRGGALVIIGGGSVVMYPGTRLNFTLNQALEVGGAVYSESEYGAEDLVYQQCFIRYHQPTVHPDHWNASFAFSSNSAGEREGEGTVYTTSLLPCVWPEEDTSGLDVARALCWQGWTYDGQDATELTNCSKYISTAPASFANAQVNTVSLYPGHTTAVPVRMRDDYGALVDRVVYQVSSWNSSAVRAADTSVYVTNNQISVYGIPGTTGRDQDLFLETQGPRVLTTVLKVSLLPCPPGYTPEYSDEGGGVVRRCKCAYSLYFTCNSSEMSAHILPGYCIRYNESGLDSETYSYQSSGHNQTMIVVECPFTLKTGKPVKLPDSYNSSLERAFCAAIDRSGKFCSHCSKDHAVDVNDIHNCVKCGEQEYQFGWLIYLLTNIVPITIFFFVVALFHISTTSAPMYAFVFFAQITAVRYFHDQLPWVFGLSQQTQALRFLLLVPYSIWNLDFFIFTGVICLGKDLTVMYSLLLKYLLALYPMLLIFLSYLCIELYDHNYRIVVYLWRPFRSCLKRYRRNWHPRTSIIDSFATFLMISYTKVTVITITLLTPAQQYYVYRDKTSKVGDGNVFYFDPQYEFFEPPHLYLGLLALVIAVVVVLAPPLFLFLYPTKLFQNCLHKCSGRSRQAVHTFADAFQGCFKNRTINNRDYRYFSGLYLLLRIMFLLIYAVETPTYVQLLLQQVLCTLAVLVFALVKPYKEAFYNKVDMTTFSLLSLMNTLSFANYTHSAVNGQTSQALFAINYALGFLPLVYISLYLLYLFLKWRGIIVPNPVVKEITIGKSTPSLASEEYSSTSDIPDRLLHPEHYTINSSPSTGAGVTSESCTSTSDLTGVGGAEEEKGAGPVVSKRPRQRATEGSYFLQKARNMKNYSSM